MFEGCLTLKVFPKFSKKWLKESEDFGNTFRIAIRVVEQPSGFFLAIASLSFSKKQMLTSVT